MKKFYFAIAAAAVCFASCNKEVVVTPVNEDVDSHLVQMTFTASTVETKTTLGALSSGEYPVLWADSDQIKVIAVDAGGTTLYTDVFTIDAGGSSTATFTGTSYADAAAYYAVYPATLSATVSGTGTSATIALTNYKSHDVTAVEAGFDTSRAVMFAVADAGVFTFKHGVSFFKITIGIENVSSVKFRVPSSDGGARIFGDPTYKVSDGTTSGYAGGDKNNNYVTLAPASGTLTKGATYYVPFAAKASSLSTYLQLTYTVGGNTASKKTTKLNGTFANGHVYDLGTPPFSFAPVINAPDVNIVAADEGGTITYTVDNAVSGGVLTAAIQDAGTISNLVLGAPASGSLTFTCDANTETTAKTATVRLTYTYNDPAETVTKDVVINQLATGAVITKETHTWDFATFTDEEMVAITGKAANANATAGQTWDFGDGLTMVTNGSSKWNKQTISSVEYKWVATGGKYGNNQKFFSFTTASVGTITVLYASGGGASRALTIKSNGESSERTDSANVSTSTSDLKTVTFSAVAAGSILLYSNVDNVRIYSISFVED